MAFFLDDAHQENDADQADDRQICPNSISARMAPTPADGSVERMVMG